MSGQRLLDLRRRHESAGASTLSGDLVDSLSEWTLAPRENSQWEGLAADGEGFAFVLQEHPGDERDPSYVIRTVNDLTFFENRLFAISRKSQVIVELEAEADPDEVSLRVDEHWAVPSEVMHPEGLAITDGAAPIVADDLAPEEDAGGPNIFVLSRM